MGSFGGFYKGEKKKAKKDKEVKNAFKDAPVFAMPEIITKKKQA
jgi:hypothetical protein